MPVSVDDSLSLVDVSGYAGDTVWVPMNLTNTAGLGAFLSFLRYDSTFLTPVENPSLPETIWARPKGRLKASLDAGPDDTFWALTSQSAADSGAIVVSFNALTAVLSPDIAVGNGTICLIPFVINPAAPIGAITDIWFYSVNDFFVNGTDTFWVDCRGTSFSYYNGLANIWPTTGDATVTVVQSPGTCCIGIRGDANLPVQSMSLI
ncbi:MAG: cohesin domain-containing protein [bacterium]|nr:cohesin domain-containing protein [bacterium]